MAFVETSNASEAYRAAYNVRPKTAPKTVWADSSQLLAHPEVAQRIAEIRAELAERKMVTLEALTEELDEAREMAVRMEQSTAMTAATMGKAKLNGLLVDKQETKHGFADPIVALFEKVAEGTKRIGS